MRNRIIRYGVVPVNPLYAQIATTSEPKKKKKTLTAFHLLAVMMNRINRTRLCPLIYNGHLPILGLL